MARILLTVLGLIALGQGAAAAAEGVAMNNARLDQLIRQLDGIEGEIEGGTGAWRFRYKGRLVFVFTDERADRMRIMAPVAPSDTLRKDRLFRLLQANFASAMDARYAIASETLWSLYLHELSPLTVDQFHSGFLQVVTLAATFGTDYSSGALRFGGSDDPV